MDGICQFELLSDLPPRGEAKAVLLEWNGKEYMRSATEVTVYEFVKQHGRIGDRGYTFHSEASDRWEVLSGLFEQNTGFPIP